MKHIYKLSMNHCTPCKQYAPTFKKVAKEFPEYCWQELSIDDNDEASRIAVQLKIRSVPATIVTDETWGEYKVKIGVLTEDELKEFVNGL